MTNMNNNLQVFENFGLPEFLKDADENVINAFVKVYRDPDIPSEGLRQELVRTKFV